MEFATSLPSRFMPQDFRNANLRGRSFRGQDLTNADFSYADIRGANFTNAILIGANFNYVKAGLQRRWVVGSVVGSLLLSALSGFISAYAGVLLGLLLGEYFFSGMAALIVLTIFFVVTVRQGLGAALGALAVSVVATVVVVVAVGTESDPLAAVVVQTLAIAGVVAGIVVGSLAVAIAMVRAGTVALAIVGTFAVPGAVLGTWTGFPRTMTEAGPWAIATAGAVTVALVTLNAYVGWWTLAGDKKYALIRTPTLALSAKGGTSFRRANLTDANFTQATLKSTDLRRAVLTRTCWFKANKLDQARIEGTYLENPQVRELAITKDGQDKNFDYQDLRALNLEDAELAHASFIGANLSEATLQNANLSKAKLVQTQLYRTDLTHACLTGAYIQDWSISTDTKLDEVKCECIYMRLPTKDDPDACRKPDNRQETFKEGDFSDFIAPIIKTLDLYRRQNIDPRVVGRTFKTLDFYHYEGIDPSAAAIALKQLAEKYPEAGLHVVALEGRGEDKLRLQAQVTDEVDRSELSEEYFEKYSQIKSLPYKDIQALLAGIAEKDERIRSLENILMAAIKDSNKFYIETYHNFGDTMSEYKGNKIDFGGVSGSSIGGVAGGDFTGAAAAGDQNITGAAVGSISGTVTNTIGQLQESDAPEAPKLAELLKQLQAAIEAESELSEEDKAEALEQVQALAEAGKNPQEGVMQKTAKTAMKILKGTVAGLPSAAALIEACNKLLPAIAGVIGLV